MPTITNSLKSWSNGSDTRKKYKITNVTTNNNSSNILSKGDLTNLLKNMDQPLSIIHDELEYLSNYITCPHSFIFSGPHGYVLSVLNIKNNMDVEVGTSFNTLHIGVNAIGIAKETNKISIVVGREHTSNLFWRYSCVCTPIQVCNRTIGFLNLTFPKMEDPTFAIPMMKQLSKNIEGKLIKLCPVFQKEEIFTKFNNYNMTSREKEIAYEWLNNSSCEEIACINSISIHTVRTHVKRIYSKTNTFNKGDFFSKFKI
ncbi:helix-turn-helix transcriptional regulator [Bacillus sp. MN7755]